MEGRFLLSSNEDPAEGNIYSDKSALVLDWLLRKEKKREHFSLREVAKEAGVSIGLVQRVFGILVQKGFMRTEGVRTAKTFFFNKSKLLLENWLEHYTIAKKCRMKTYHSGFTGRSELLKALSQSKLGPQVVLALHSAAEAHGYKNTNLTTLELYMLDPTIESKLVSALHLEPQERGYEVLLIEPYYKALLKQDMKSYNTIAVCPLLLTFLDLYHFPLRGQEQAEFIAQRASEIKRIYKNS